MILPLIQPADRCGIVGIVAEVGEGDIHSLAVAGIDSHLVGIVKALQCNGCLRGIHAADIKAVD